jgi:prepilin-type processing-associated H-X9-DG protein
VSGTARGANVTLFGTEPLFRAHPEGLYPQVANALWWDGS